MSLIEDMDEYTRRRKARAEAEGRAPEKPLEQRRAEAKAHAAATNARLDEKAAAMERHPAGSAVEDGNYIPHFPPRRHLIADVIDAAWDGVAQAVLWIVRWRR